MPWRLLTARRARGGVRHRARRGTRPADPRLLDRRAVRPARRRSRSPSASTGEISRPTPSSARRSRWSEIDPADVRRPDPPRRARAGHAAVPRPRRAAGEGRRVLGARPAGRRHLPRRARAGAHRDPDTGHSVLAGRRTTCLPKYMERSAYLLTVWKLGRYYRTYPAYVRGRGAARAGRPGPVRARARACSSRAAPRATTRAAFVVEDGRYVSARWPGDAYLFGRRFLAMLAGDLFACRRQVRW